MTRPFVGAPDTRDRSEIVVGQVWRHHSTGNYEVVGFGMHGSVVIARTDSMQPRPVWPEYLRRNFVLLPGAAS